ncbi:hypothetical protein BDA96_02G101200 [Sorghum bicolor]|uniref:Uncharacterized protein n=1 Tax=Sorghum bicolor TaxID=4558 RepID=A0A921RMX4_SORBI|nr:hypothetical protein BDA96_02G101200 [Sorghum bicolor]
MRVDCPAISCRHRHRSCTACDHLEGRIIYVVSMNVLLASIPVATLTLPLALNKQQGSLVMLVLIVC